MKIANVVLTPPLLWKSNVLDDDAARRRAAITSTGQDERPAVTERDVSTLGVIATGLSVAGTTMGAYHGYKRNDSVGWGIGWALLGGAFPVIAIPIMLAQGFGEKARK